MKRILLSILAIILCIAAFSGCDKECGHNWERIGNYNESTAQDKCAKCGETRLYTDPNHIPDKRLPILMTIAETRPSCVAFEHKDGNPYCFYAHDNDGKLYRVLWSDFNGLKEKARIVVDHNDNIVALNYDEYPDGGWTPQYEITAISVYSEEEWKDIMENTSPAEYFQVQKNDNGRIIFSVIAGFPEAKYKHKDIDGEEHAEIALNNENGEINSLLFGLLNGKVTISDDESNVFTDSVSMTCSYTSDDGHVEIIVVYEFRWSSAGNTLTILKDNSLVGTVLLSDDEMTAFKDVLDEYKNNACDGCGHDGLTNSYDVAQIVIDYEKSLKEEIDKLHKENPEYSYHYHPIDQIHCIYILSSNASADAVVENHDMDNLFAEAEVSALNAIKMINIIFNRNDFTESMHQKINQIREEDPLIKNLLVNMEREWVESYIPKIEYYTDHKTMLDYEIASGVVNLRDDKCFIIKSKEEYNNYLNNILESIDYDYLKEIVSKQKDLYDEAFFEENALIITRTISRSSGSIKLTVNNLYVSENKVYVVVRTDIPGMGTEDMQYASFTFKVPKNKVDAVTEVIVLE